MKGWFLAHPMAIAAAGFLAGAALVGGVWGAVAAATGGDSSPGDPVAGAGSSPVSPGATPFDSPDQPTASGEPGSSLPPVPPRTVECPTATTTVSTAAELESALEDPAPGDVIVLLPGRYLGEFATTASGTPDDRITLCGPQDAILDGDNVRGGYVFHLDGAEYWHLLGFSVTNGQKGVMADGTTGSIIEGLTVWHIGDEAIHLRRHSTDNVVVRNDISETGLRREKFGEGVYVGSAESNWCTITDCQPDRSDRNVVEGNAIHGTSAESVDVKEGTSGGVVRNNTFDGSAMTEDGADSWVDIKGNDWLIEGNVGTDSPLDGFQTHEIVDGWGTRNVFRGNIANVNGPGFGFSLTPARDNVVTCDNKASAAGEGFSNVTCSG